MDRASVLVLVKDELRDRLSRATCAHHGSQEIAAAIGRYERALADCQLGRFENVQALFEQLLRRPHVSKRQYLTGLTNGLRQIQ